MITLTTPASVNSVLGGNAPISYDKFVLASITYDTVNKQVTSQITISSSANPDMQAVTGSMTINCVTAKLTIAVPQLDFYRQVTLTGPQNTFVTDNVIRASQNTLESGLVTLGVVAGVQTTGT
jgi:hypothetical protein